MASIFAQTSYAGGQVIAWGYNANGQCNVPAEAQSQVSAIACGWSHSLALKEGKVIAWGVNDHGQCNVPAEAQSNVSAIAAGGSNSLALKEGKVIAWGANDYGQRNVSAEAQSNVSAIAAGIAHGLALADGKVIAWGNNAFDQCNVPKEAQSNVSAIAAGIAHSLALADGKVIAWGANDCGQRNVPAEAQSNANAIACGGSHSLALKEGKVIAWGANNFGQCNVPAEAQSNVSAIACGAYFSLALKDGKVIVWGYNMNDQCTVPIAGQSGVIAIVGGDFHVLALKAKSLKVQNDFDGDSRTDPAIYYPSRGLWQVLLTGSWTITNVTLGGGNYLPAPGDYDGDGKTDFAVFDSTTGKWLGKLSDGREGEACFGHPGTWPVPADFDGDRFTDLCVYDPLTGIWSGFSLNKGWSGSVQWGHLGDFRPWENPQTYTILPMPFDYNQDGVDDLAYYYRGLSMADSAWSILYIGIGSEYYVWGSSGSLPAPGKYRSEILSVPTGAGVYKIKTASWYVPYMNGYAMGVYGQTLPVPAGDYDGNGYDDNATYNYTNGEWIVYLNDGTGIPAALGSYYFPFGGPGAVPANIYSTLYNLARYSTKPWP